MLFKAKTPVKYRGRRIEIGEEVDVFKKDEELLSKYGRVKEKKVKKKVEKKEEPKADKEKK